MARPSKQEEAARWLRSYLAQGSRPQQDVKEAASGLGISRATLNRVKLSLGVESLRRGAGFHWRDPDVLEEQAGSQSLVDAIDRMADKLSRAIRQLGHLGQQTQPQPEPESIFPNEADKFAFGFVTEDYERSTPEVLLRYLQFQERQLKSIAAEPQSANRDYRINFLKKQIQQTEQWYAKKNNTSF